MKTRNKVLVLMLSAVLLVATSVFGTMAYLQDTETVTNTFTVGDVGITLDEADVTTDGKYETDETNRVTANTYHLLPGHSYIKDPTVHVTGGSEDCYVYVTVDNQIATIEAETVAGVYDKIEDQMGAKGWKVLMDDTVPVQKDGKTVYYYQDKVVKNVNATDLSVFDSFMIKGEAKSEDLDDFVNSQIVITAYAVQADGFATQLAAWKAAYGN